MRAELSASMLLIAACLVTGRVGAWQQPTPPASSSTFEVASIKRNNSGSPAFSNSSMPGRYVLVNAPIRSMIAFAYPVSSGELEGGPDWISSERYDVNASAGREVTTEELRPMVRALLAERFGFRAHVETRRRPTYALMLVRDDGRLGPEIRAVDVDCPAVSAANAAAARGSRTPPPPAANGAPPCGMLQEPNGPLKSGGVPIEMLARSLWRSAGRPVVNKTGLRGIYEFTLTYSPAIGGGDPADDRPSVFTAVREQLGLKLEPEENPLDVLVIDRIERPTPD